MPENAMIGDDPLADGMNISVRMRHDFTVTNADRFLVAARRAYREMHPDVDAEQVNVMVSCAADAVFTMLEHLGLVGEAAQSRLAAVVANGLAVGGWRAEITPNEPDPLRLGHDCLRTGDAFALPTTENQ